MDLSVTIRSIDYADRTPICMTWICLSQYRVLSMLTGLPYTWCVSVCHDIMYCRTQICMIWICLSWYRVLFMLKALQFAWRESACLNKKYWLCWQDSDMRDMDLSLQIQIIVYADRTVIWVLCICLYGGNHLLHWKHSHLHVMSISMTSQIISHTLFRLAFA